MTQPAPWITYRPELKVLDCTVRDGGLINKHRFTDETIALLVGLADACGLPVICDAGVGTASKIRGRPASPR